MDMICHQAPRMNLTLVQKSLLGQEFQVKKVILLRAEAG
jgi:hypothetical protein